MSSETLSETLVNAIKNNNVAALHEKITTTAKSNASQLGGACYSIPGKISKKLPSESLTLLHIAAFYDSLDCFVVLENSGLKIDMASAASYTPLHYAVYNASFEVVCYILKRAPTMARALPAVEHHLVYLAAYAGDPDILHLLLKNGADLRAEENKKNQPMSTALRNKHVECMKLLLDYDRDPNEIDKLQDYSPLMMAITRDLKEAVPMLLESGEDPCYVTRKMNDKKMALFLACEKGPEWLEVVRMICTKLNSAKLDLESTVKDKAAIHYACGSGSLEILREVVGVGVDVNRLDKNERTGMHYVLDRGYTEQMIIDMLEVMTQHGFRLDASVLYDFLESMKKQYQVIEWLLKHGIDPMTKFNGRLLADMMFNRVKRGDMKMKAIYDQWVKPVHNPPK